MGPRSSQHPPDDGPSARADRPTSVIVVELEDVVPRRVLDRPNLLVESTVDPTAKIRALQHGRGSPAWARGCVLRPRPDLQVPGESKKEAIRRLEAAGFTVNRSQELWRVYVLELGPAPEGVMGWVYVGETSKDVDERIEQHRTAQLRKDGKASLNSRVVTRHFVRRRHDLEPPYPLFSREQSRQLESEWAERLRAKGYKVDGGH